MTEEEIKLKLFEIIANNSSDLCDSGEYMPPLAVAENVKDVYNSLFKKGE